MNITKIAVIDDRKHLVQKLGQAIRIAGFEAVEITTQPFETVEDLVEKVSTSQMVLLDHELGPDFSGEDVARQLCSRVVLVTTSDHSRTKAYCTNCLLGKEYASLEKLAESIRAKVQSAET